MQADSETLTAPAPWTCKAQVYSIFFLSKPDQTSKDGLPPIAYSPLERDSHFASAEAGQFIGGLGGFMVVRYTDTPVGPYDELIIIPGTFKYDKKDKGQSKEKQSPRISRIYVSQKHTLYNGRLNWNIPKQMARFEWDDLPSGAKQVKVFPYDTDGGDADALRPSPTPFFQLSFKTIPFVPAFPLSTSWSKYLRLDFTLVQPPVPKGASKEVVGTERWCEVETTQATRCAHLGWFDLCQKDQSGTSMPLFENFWPGLGRWHLGIRMDDATVEIPEGKYWDCPGKVNI